MHVVLSGGDRDARSWGFAAVIQRLMVRRPETNWTCPVASGVVFLADFRYQFGMRMESIPNDDVEVTEEGDPRGPPGTPISLLEQHKVHEFVFQGFQVTPTLG